MLDLGQYESLGAALRSAIERWAEEVCLIESDQEQERCRLTYRQFGDAALRVAAGLPEKRISPSGRAAVLMSNQSKKLIFAYDGFFFGGGLLALHYKIKPR